MFFLLVWWYTAWYVWSAYAREAEIGPTGERQPDVNSDKPKVRRENTERSQIGKDNQNNQRRQIYS